MNADRSTRPSPWSYCLFIIVAVLPICILSSEFVQAQGRPALRGISRVSVGVFVDGRELPSGISESRLKTIIELKLRTAGLLVQRERPFAPVGIVGLPLVLLTLRAIPAQVNGRVVGYSFSTDIAVHEYRYLAARDAVLPVELWQRAGLNTTPTEEAASDVERVVAIVLDEFLNDWLAANQGR